MFGGGLDTLCAVLPWVQRRNGPNRQAPQKRIQVTVLQHLDSRVVAPTGIEPASRVPETLILSIELRSQKKTVRGERTVRFVVEIRGFEPRTSCMPCKRSSQLSYTPSTRWFPPSLWKREGKYRRFLGSPNGSSIGRPRPECGSIHCGHRTQGECAIHRSPPMSTLLLSVGPGFSRANRTRPIRRLEQTAWSNRIGQ